MTKFILTLSAVLLASLTLPAAQGATKSAGDPAQATLKNVRSLAIAATNEADELRMMIGDRHEAPESQAQELRDLRVHFDRMGQDIAKLEAVRSSLSSWEEQAFSRVEPLIQAGAGDTSRAIAYFNNNRWEAWGSQDAGYVNRIYQASNQVASTLTSYLKYQKLHAETPARVSQPSAGMND